MSQYGMPPTPTMTELSACPRKSIGKAYSDHLESNHLKINFYPQMKPVRLADYLSYRLYHAHDLWHSVLGYSVDAQGEIELQAFTLAQMNVPTSAMLITAGVP